MSVTVRPAVAADATEIHRMIVALAVYEHEPNAVEATPASLAKSLFGADPHAFAHVAELDGRAVGVALWFLNFSTWTGRPGLFLEDLYVDDAVRGQGVARALLGALAREARARDCPRMDWAVLSWNEQAKAVYRKLGGRRQQDWEPWRIEGEALAALAAG